MTQVLSGRIMELSAQRVIALWSGQLWKEIGMRIQLSDHFTYRKLLRFTPPSILMMVFTSVYGVADGFFVSNVAGKTPFAAVNLIMPFLMIVATVGLCSAQHRRPAITTVPGTMMS